MENKKMTVWAKPRFKKVLTEAPDITGVEQEEAEDTFDSVKSLGYEQFVAKLGDAKVRKMLQFMIDKGYGMMDVSYEKVALPTDKLIPTQSEIAMANSLDRNLQDAKNVEALFGNPVTVGLPIVVFNKKYIIDGHHRWSQLACFNPKASIVAFNFDVPGESGDAGALDVLRDFQTGIALLYDKQPPQGKAGGINLLDASGVEKAKVHIEETITPDVVNVIYTKAGLGNATEEEKKKAAVVEYLVNNIKNLPRPIANAPARVYMPQTDPKVLASVRKKMLDAGKDTNPSATPAKGDGQKTEGMTKKRKARRIQEAVENYGKAVEEVTKPLDTLDKPEGLKPVCNQVYGGAVEDINKAHKEIAQMYVQKMKEARGIVPKTPGKGKPLPKSVYTEVGGKLELDESLFREARSAKQVEEVDNDVWTAVYDSIFAGNRFARIDLTAKIGKKMKVDADRYIAAHRYAGKSLSPTDIGIKTGEDDDLHEYLRKVAEVYRFDFEEAGEGDRRAAIIRIPSDIAAMEVSEYFPEIGIEEKEVRMVKGKSPVKESLTIFCDFSDYRPWGQAVSTYDKIEEAGMLDDLENYLEEIYPEGIGETELNDILAYDWESVLDALGLSEEEEEEDEEEEDEEEEDEE